MNNAIGTRLQNLARTAFLCTAVPTLSGLLACQTPSVPNDEPAATRPTPKVGVVKIDYGANGTVDAVVMVPVEGYTAASTAQPVALAPQ